MTFALESVKVGERINSCNAEVGKIGLLLLFLCVAVKKKQARRVLLLSVWKETGPCQGCGSRWVESTRTDSQAWQTVICADNGKRVYGEAFIS